jgi:hypothetical protein
MPIDEPKEVAMTSMEQLGEAFQLGSVLSRIETTLGHNTGVIERTDRTVTDMSTRLGALEVNHGRQSERISTAFNRIEALEARPAFDYVPRADFVELKDEVKAGRLSWGKIAVLLGALATIAGLLIFANRLIPA